MQFKSITPKLLDAIRKVRDEHQVVFYFKKQTTIKSYNKEVRDEHQVDLYFKKKHKTMK